MIRPVRRDLLLLASVIVTLNVPSSGSAAFTAIGDSPDVFDEPNLIGLNPFPDNLNPSVLETLYGEANLRRVDDRFDIAFRHTGVEATVTPVAHFTALSSLLRRPDGTQFGAPVAFAGPSQYGYLASTFVGRINLVDSGPRFMLKLGSTDNYGYSDPSLNTAYWLPVSDQLVTFEIVGNAGHPDNVIGNYVLAWEDQPRVDRDYQDVVFELSGALPIPEPAALLLLTCGAVFVCRPLSVKRRAPLGPGRSSGRQPLVASRLPRERRLPASAKSQ